jgi:TRAP-type C4-dicarboxylate transport system substrate-binding protein
MKKIMIFHVIIFLFVSIIMVGCSSNSETTSNGTNEGSLEESQNGSDSTETRVFKISHIGPQNHIWTPSMEKFKEELENRSNGRFTLEIYTDAVLGDDPDLMNQMEAGTLEMAWINSVALGNYSESFNAWMLPYLLEGPEAAFEMAQTEEALEILNTLGNNGVHGLGFVYLETRGLLMSDDIKVNEISDLKGYKIRVTPGPVVLDWWETVGALPTAVPLPETFNAFQTGVVDGIDQGPVGVVGARYYEVSKNYVKTDHMIFNGAALVSQKIWNELSDEDKQIIEKAFKAAQEYNLQLSLDWESQNLEEFESHGGVVTELSDMTTALELANEFQNKYAEQDPLIKAFVEKAKEIGSK